MSYLGTNKIGKMYLGSTEIAKAYLGSDLVYKKQPALPYDAEIEYLESTGTQYIDTLVNLQEIVEFTVNLSISKTISSNGMVMGATYDDSPVPKFQLYINSSQKWGYPNVSYFNIRGISPGGSVSIGTRYTPIVTSINPQDSLVSILLFARNNDRGESFPIDGLRTYFCKIKRGNSFVRDFVPVRVGQVGYMYDKVSRQLFGNSGTGNFILGNDKN